MCVLQRGGNTFICLVVEFMNFNGLSYVTCGTHRNTMAARVAAIEKWTAVADICRCLHNFNGVLQVCAAFTNAAVFRLKKTWDKVPKTVRNSFPIFVDYFFFSFFQMNLLCSLWPIINTFLHDCGWCEILD